MTKNVRNLFICTGLAFAVCLFAMHPAFAVLEGTARDQLEFLDFSETAIKDSLYAQKGRQVFNRDKRAYTRGITEHGSPIIYEPDVYTWELAMNEHRKKMAAMKPPVVPNAPALPEVTPVPMSPTPIMPSEPSVETDGRLQNINRIKQDLIKHMNSYTNSEIPALLPALPDLPRGKKGDSCDAAY